jgi:hypothetical protein
MLATEWNEHGASKTWPGSPSWESPSAGAFPVLYHGIVAGLVPPFILELLSHFEIQVLHIHPMSLTILAICAFWCEAFVRVRTSVALFHHFYSARLNNGGLRAGCVTFYAESRWIDMDWEKKVNDFR